MREKLATIEQIRAWSNKVLDRATELRDAGKEVEAYAFLKNVHTQPIKYDCDCNVCEFLRRNPKP